MITLPLHRAPCRAALVAGLYLLVVALPAAAQVGVNFDLESSCEFQPFSDTARTSITDAMANADFAVRYFDEKFATDPSVYIKWFGDPNYKNDVYIQDGEYRQGIERNFRQVRNAIHNWKFQVTCREVYPKCCTDDDGTPKFDACVNAAQFNPPFIIQVCMTGQQRAIDPTGYGSMAVMWDHEVSHFRSNNENGDEGAALTDDVVGGHSPQNTQATAKTNPVGNRSNAYAYTYFWTDVRNYFGCGGPGGGCAVTRPGAGTGGSLAVILLLGALLVRRRFRMKPMIVKASVLLLLPPVMGGLAACIRNARAQLVGPVARIEPDRRFSCTLQAPPTVQQGQPIPVTYTLRNISPQPLKILRAGTPLYGKGDHFTVTCDGVRAPYNYGIIGDFWGPPPAKAYAILKPNEAATATLDATSLYGIRPGTCTIAAHAGLDDVSTDPDMPPRSISAAEGVLLDCAPVTVTVLP